MVARVSLAELAGAGVVLHSAEAAAIVIDVCRQLERGAIRGIPSTHVIRLTPDGTIVAEGPITTDHPPIAKAAQLLNDLLPAFDAPPAYHVPGGLRLVAARAVGTLDLPPFASLEEFCTALSRFAANDLASTVRTVYRAWELAKSPRALTISDVRRARRATGLSLGDISSVCGVDAALLRELEWGYLKNWRNDAIGRSWLSGYAKASGLDQLPQVAPKLAPRGQLVDFAAAKHTHKILIAYRPYDACAVISFGESRKIDQHSSGRVAGPNDQSVLACILMAIHLEHIRDAIRDKGRGFPFAGRRHARCAKRIGILPSARCIDHSPRKIDPLTGANRVDREGKEVTGPVAADNLIDAPPRDRSDMGPRLNNGPGR